ncbi:MAG TPA: hypothetical protein VNY05_26210 [Candidatus Acidoferrales bacterium]|jgi:hypothetical protein|nr:hypothetical protein [Candidatus Acidoferrales bacterium]
MKRATITINDDLETALESYVRSQEAPPALTTVVQAALGEYLARRGAAPPSHPLRITPAKKGSGKSDISLRHDRYFAGK